ncbi:MAG TPA: flavodoxin [Armatimonadetes bacterium]|jgi:NAD(P)H dehydrogenase (quinone)|nr:flavodoxin [Armatimonadota bacterium]
MPGMLITYYTRSGNTETMAELVAEGARGVDGIGVEVRSVDMVAPDDLLGFDAIIIGSPVYFGTMAAEIKKLIDDSVVHFTKLDGKVGGAFTSSGGAHGGNETTVLDILKALMVHGMIVKGVSAGAHYGPVAVGAPDDDEAEECRRYGYDVAELTMKLFG